MREHEISETNRGCKKSLKAVQRNELNIANTKMEFYDIYALLKDTLVVFQSSQN